MEKWKKWSELYLVSNTGKIKHSRLSPKCAGKEIKVANNGLVYNLIVEGGKKTCLSINRLVWETFNGPIPEGKTVRIKKDFGLDDLFIDRLYLSDDGVLGRAVGITALFPGDILLRFETKKELKEFLGKSDKRTLKVEVKEGFFYTIEGFREAK